MNRALMLDPYGPTHSLRPGAGPMSDVFMTADHFPRKDTPMVQHTVILEIPADQDPDAIEMRVTNLLEHHAGLPGVKVKEWHRERMIEEPEAQYVGQAGFCPECGRADA